MPHRPPKRPKVHTGIIKLKFDEREMVYQRIVLKDANDQYKDEFYVCRFFGSRDCWIDTKVLSPQMQKKVSSIPLLLREVEIDDGRIIRVVSIDWILDHFNPDTEPHGDCPLFVSPAELVERSSALSRLGGWERTQEFLREFRKQ